MAFSLRKMLSNIYYTQPEDDDNHVPYIDTVGGNGHQDYVLTSENIEFDRVEADSTSFCGCVNVPESAAKKGSLSDTDLAADTESNRKKCRKLKLDIEKASKSMSESMNSEDGSVNLENTPKHKLLDFKSADCFKNFNFNQSFDVSDVASTVSNEELDIQSLTDHSETDVSEDSNKSDIKMCRKVEADQALPGQLPSATPESFADIELDRSEDERITLLSYYQMKLDKLERSLKELLTQFQFQIEVSRVFECKTLVTPLPGTVVFTHIDSNTSKPLGIDDQRGFSPGWNFVMIKEDVDAKTRLKDRLSSMKQSIDKFIESYVDQITKPRLIRSFTYDVPKPKQLYRTRLSYKKKLKHYDFPDLREAMLNLFCPEDSANNESKCSCQCHQSDPDTPKSDIVVADQSITSSIGNFTLDSTTLSAYSESLDQIISYNSFETDSLYSTLLQKAAIERISFYIQVHSIQLKCAIDCESKNVMMFYCPTCKVTEYEENGLLKHILSPSHCENIHFVYKTAYVKKCIGAGKEIQPSTVLNPMKMYRDENKIVCFGDAFYACSLCFESVIVGESVLMSHCLEAEHVNRRDMLEDMFE